MHSIAALSLVLAALTSAQSLYSSSTVAAYGSTPVYSSAPVYSSIPYDNPFTIYLTMTNSLGIITGMPAVATSQPAAASIYATGSLSAQKYSTQEPLPGSLITPTSMPHGGQASMQTTPSPGTLQSSQAVESGNAAPTLAVAGGAAAAIVAGLGGVVAALL